MPCEEHNQSGGGQVESRYRLAPSFGTKRFAEIRDLLPGVSEKVLTAQLRQLEKDGVLRRMVTPLIPTRVDYELTEAGWELIPIMESMCEWGTKHLGIIATLPRRAPNVGLTA